MDQRVYVDLYAGGAFSHVQGSRTFLKGSPVIALSVSNPFSKYVFCDEDEDLVALKARSQRIAPSGDVSYGPANAMPTLTKWTEATWSPVRGCTKISPGCKHCYAERFAERFRDVPDHPFEDGFDLRLVPQKLAEPILWGEPKMIFVNSISDLFHSAYVSDNEDREALPSSYISRLAKTMCVARWHTYQILSKRSTRLREMLCGPLKAAAKQLHIWWGVSVEDRKYGLPRIAELRTTPAATTKARANNRKRDANTARKGAMNRRYTRGVCAVSLPPGPTAIVTDCEPSLRAALLQPDSGSPAGGFALLDTEILFHVRRFSTLM